jgi:hypothetical protein
MAFHTYLVAISLDSGRYAVASQTLAHINSSTLRDAGLLHDVSESAGYLDEAAIIQKADFRKFLLPEASYKAAIEWFSSLPAEVMFIVVHRAEWESGLGE